MPDPETDGHGFWSVARQDPDRTALILDDGSTVSFGDLERRANQVSHGLRAAGLSRGDAVAAVLRNGREYYELALATLQTGTYLVPVNRNLTGGEMDYIIGDSGARVLVVEADIAERISPTALPEHRYVVGGPPGAGWPAFTGFAAEQPTSLPENRRLGSIMLYTSGTTGRPKGVQRALPDLPPDAAIPVLHLAQVASYGESPEQCGVHLLCSPAYHAAPGWHSLSFLHAGHTVLIHGKFDAARTLDDIGRYGVTSSHMVPTHFHRLLGLPPDVRARADLSSLRVLITAGAPCPAWLKTAMLDWVGPIVFEYLGSTEGSLTRVTPAEARDHPGTVGRPLPGVDVRILDEAGEALGPNEPGTIWFGSADGTPPAFSYRGDPVKTASMRRDHLVTVGDLGLLDEDGYLFLLDRRDDLIISGGVNIYPAEVEACLLADPGVSDVAVVGITDREWGQRTVAVLEVAPEAHPDLVARLRERCSRDLAGFKHPREFVVVDRLPRSESGKLQRGRLRRDLDARPQTSSV